jgi:hypothetical protein
MSHQHTPIFMLDAETPPQPSAAVRVKPVDAIHPPQRAALEDLIPDRGSVSKLQLSEPGKVLNCDRESHCRRQSFCLHEGP